MKLIFIHGRDQQGQNPSLVQKQWEGALKRGLQRAGLPELKGVTVSFPFYGNTLDGYVRALNTPPPGIATRGVSANDEAIFRAQLVADLVQNAGITDAQVQRHYGGEPQEMGPLNWRWVQAMLRALDGTGLAEDLIERFTQDVYLYLTRAPIRAAIDALVAQCISSEPSVVVAHSLGTVVAYKVLQAGGAQFAIRRFVTLGSPLGVETIKRYVVPPGLSMPSGVLEWFNAFDVRDVVALRPLDQEVFPITPAIINMCDVNNETHNRHGIDGYLDDATVAGWIHTALRKG